MLTFHVNTNGFNALRNEIDRVFADTFGGPLFAGVRGGASPSAFSSVDEYPPLNMFANDESLVVEAELPGLTMNDVEVLVADDELTLKGRFGARQEGVTYHRSERGHGSFSRTVRLPFAVNADKVAAALRDGILTVTLPKAESAKPRKIEVRAAG